MSLHSFLGVWCTTFSLAFIWPQVWRTVRHDTTHGISAFSVVHGLAGSAIWLAYGITADRPAIWFSNASFIVAQSIIISVLLRHQRMPVSLLFKFAVILATVLAIFLPVSSAVIGWIATFTSASSLVPQVVHVVRTDNLHGISIVSWLMTVFSAASWMIYGWVLDDPIMSVINYINIPMMFVIITKSWQWRTRNDVPIFARAGTA